MTTACKARFRSESNSIKYKRLLIDCPLTVLIAVCMISRVTFRRHVWFVLFYTGYSVHIILSNRIQDPTSLTGHISISTWGGSRLLFGLVTTWFPVFLPLPKPIPVPLRSPNQALSSATIQYWPITPNTISIRISVIARFWRQNTVIEEQPTMRPFRVKSTIYSTIPAGAVSIDFQVIPW